MTPTYFDKPVSFRCPIKGISTTIGTAEDALAHLAFWPPTIGHVAIARKWGLWLCKEALTDPRLGWNARAGFQAIAAAYGYRVDYEDQRHS